MDAQLYDQKNFGVIPLGGEYPIAKILLSLKQFNF